MAAGRHTLMDVDRKIYEPEATLNADQLGLQSGTVRKHTLRGGLCEGVDIVEVDNGAFSFALLPTRGMGVWKAWHEDVEIGWKSPIKGPVHPSFVPLAEPSGFGWLDGFDELMCRCGLESNGPPEFDASGRLKFGLHGRIANCPAHTLAVAGDPATQEIVVTAVVDECRFHFQKLRLTTTIRTRIGELGFRIVDEVLNLSAKPTTTQILYHVNIGHPVLEAGSQFVAPAKIVVPHNQHSARGISSWDRFAAGRSDYSEECYFLQLNSGSDGLTQVLLKNASDAFGVSLSFRTDQLPCCTLWKNTAADSDGCVTGIEPATNYPNLPSFEAEHGRVRMMAAGQSARYELGFQWHPDIASVQEVESAIARLQGSAPPEICDRAPAGWSSH